MNIRFLYDLARAGRSRGENREAILDGKGLTRQRKLTKDWGNEKEIRERGIPCSSLSITILMPFLDEGNVDELSIEHFKCLGSKTFWHPSKVLDQYCG